MPDNKRNRNSQKGNDRENRTGSDKKQPSDNYRKLPGNPKQGDDISTHGDTSHGKYSKTRKRDDEINNAEVRGEPE